MNNRTAYRIVVVLLMVSTLACSSLPVSGNAAFLQSLREETSVEATWFDDRLVRAKALDSHAGMDALRNTHICRRHA